MAINCTSQFDRAHDRYLEPPDPEELPDIDEDAEHDRRRQLRLDEEDWIARKIEMEGSHGN